MTDSPQSPGMVIREYLEAKGWTQTDLANVLGRTVGAVNEIIQGKRGITPETAIALSDAFHTAPEFWMDLETRYRLALAPRDNGEVRKRAAIFDLAPVKEMERRGWIPKTKSIDELNDALCRFYGVASLDENPSYAVSPRRSAAEDAEELTPLQVAWYFRARNIASGLPWPRYSDDKIDACIKRLRVLAAFPQETRKVPTALAEFGIRFVIVEPLAGSDIDGATFWLADDQPVIALSLRFDRIDWFWFTLCHELSHVRHRDLVSIDSDLAGKDRSFAITKPPAERRADNEAAATLIDSKTLESFIQRVAPMYSKQRIIQFANKVKIHPGVIVGQLQHRGEIGWHANREMLAKVRENITATAITDGWGYTISGESEGRSNARD